MRQGFVGVAGQGGTKWRVVIAFCGDTKGILKVFLFPPNGRGAVEKCAMAGRGFADM